MRKKDDTLELFPETYQAGAEFSACGTYRYRLWRIWDTDKPLLLWIMLNPSTADDKQLDPTCARCQKWAQTWGYGGFMVANVFALRSTDPKGLYRINDPVGSENDQAIRDMVAMADKVIVAWGNHAEYKGRFTEVLQMLDEMGVEPECLVVTQEGQPGHPLYLKEELAPVPFRQALKNAAVAAG